MAENVDFEITAGVLPDIASAKKAGAQLRAAIEAELSKFAGGALSGQKGYKNVISAVSGLTETSGADTYYQLARTQRALANVSRKGMTQSQRDDYYEMLSDLNTARTTARRLAFNEPINKKMSYNRSVEKTAEAIKTLSYGITPGFKRSYRHAVLTGNKDEQANLDMILDQKSYAADQIINFAKRYPNQTTVSENQVKLAKEVKKIATTLPKTTAAMTGLAKSFVVAAAVGSAHAAIANAPTYWQEDTSRSLFGSMQAAAQRKKNWGKAGGEVAGAAAGAVGGALAGAAAGVWFLGIGAIPGAIIGGMAGAAGGGALGGELGQLPGIKDEEKLKSLQKSISQVQDRYKAHLLYGGKYSTSFGEAIQETGMASTSDVQKMMHNSATLGARMMFGQVGENEMLMYSLMPEYFAAAMNGASDAELAEAYKNSLERLPPQLRMWAAENVGGGSLGMYAYTKSPVFGNTQALRGEAQDIDTAQLIAGKGFMYGSVERAQSNMHIQYNKLRQDVEYVTEKTGINGKYGIYSAGGDKEYEAVLAELFFNRRALYDAYSSNRRISNNYDDIKSDKAEERKRGMDSSRDVARQTINIILDGQIVQTYENDIKREMSSGGGYTSTVSLE